MEMRTNLGRLQTLKQICAEPLFLSPVRSKKKEKRGSARRVDCFANRPDFPEDDYQPLGIYYFFHLHFYLVHGSWDPCNPSKSDCNVLFSFSFLFIDGFVWIMLCAFIHSSVILANGSVQMLLNSPGRISTGFNHLKIHKTH